jgi:HEAT repeat protein
MARWAQWAMVAVLGLGVAPARAEDAARIQQLVGRIESRQAAFMADEQVPVSRAALFRGALTDVRRALDELARLSEPAVPALARLLGGAKVHLRANAAYALGVVGGPKTAPSLAGASNDAAAAVRYQVALALGNTCSTAALPALNKLAGDAHDVVRNAAIQVSGALRDVLDAEQEGTPAQRITKLVKLTYAQPACTRLAAYGAEAVPALIAALGDSDRGVIAGAAATLARIGDKQALEPLWTRLSASLKEGKPELKFAQALGEFRSPEVWPFLKKLLDSGHPAVAYFALQRMAELANPERTATLNTFLQQLIEKGTHREAARGSEMQVNPVASVCEVLALVGDKTSLPLLQQVISEAPPAEKSIVKPLAVRAKAAIEQRGA